MSALDTIRSMEVKDFEKLAYRISGELGFEIKGAKVTDARIELDSYLKLPTGETLHYLFILSREKLSRAFLEDTVERVNNPFIKILVMSAGDVDPAAMKYADEKGIEVSQWDQFLQFLEKYGILRDLEKKEERDTAFLPSLGEVQSMEAWARNFMEEGDCRKALEYIDKGLAIKSEYEPLVRMKADCLNALGRIREAEDWYRRATSLNETDVGAWTALASLLDERGDSDGALVALDRLTEISPDSYRAWMEKGELLYRRGKYDEALLCFNRATKINPAGKEGWNNRGLVLKHLGRFEEATDSFNRSLAIDPVFWDALINKALLFHERKMYPQAVDVYGYMLRIREDPVILCQRGIAYSEWGMEKEAIEDFTRALELDPGLKPCEQELKNLTGNAHEEIPSAPPVAEAEPEIEEEPEEEEDAEESEGGEPALVPGLAAFVGAAEMKKFEEEAAETEEKEIEPETEESLEEHETGEVEAAEGGKESEEKEKPDILSGISSLSQLMARGELYFKLGMLEEALECYRSLAEAKPRSKEILNSYGVILYLMGKSDDALNIFKKAVDIDPNFEEARLNMLQIYIDSDKMPKSLDLLNTIIRQKRSAPLWIRRGKILERMERDGASVQSYEKALEISNTLIRVWNAMGISYHRIGEDEDALDSLEKGISKDERDPILWNNYGAIQYLVGDCDTAVESFERALEEDMTIAAIHNNLGVALAGKNDEIGARERFSMALERDESAAYAYNNTKYL